jgi:hypothetical protein
MSLNFEFKTRPVEDVCEVAGCRRPANIRVLGKWLCDEHWREHCRDPPTYRAASP